MLCRICLIGCLAGIYGGEASAMEASRACALSSMGVKSIQVAAETCEQLLETKDQYFAQAPEEEAPLPEEEMSALMSPIEEAPIAADPLLPSQGPPASQTSASQPALQEKREAAPLGFYGIELDGGTRSALQEHLGPDATLFEMVHSQYLKEELLIAR